MVRPRPFTLAVLAVAIGSGCLPPRDSVVPAEFRSDLPIVEIDSDGARIVDEPKVPARIRLYDNETGLTEPSRRHLELEALAGIETRGRSSQKNFPKAQYDLEFRTGGQGPFAVSVLGMPENADWIFHGPYADKSLLRNHLSYTLARRMNRYAVRSRFVELFVDEPDDDDVYRGVYLLTEKIGRASHRVDVSSESGFIVKIDALDPEDDEFIVTERGLRVIIVYPRPRDLDDDRRAFLKAFFDGFETALFSGRSADYRSRLHVDAFVDYLILAELSKNVDTFRTSTYMHLDGEGPLVMGPVWDYNQAYGNSGYHPRSVRIEGWRSDLSDVTGWLDPLRADPVFAERFAGRWHDLRQGVLSDEALIELIDSRARRLEKPASRNFARWPILGKHVLGNPTPVPRTYRAEVRALRKWLLNRARWIDTHLDDFPRTAP